MGKLFTDDFPTIENNDELNALFKVYPNYDEYYIASGSIAERRDLFEKLYASYEPYADSHFLDQIKISFDQRSWEMYFACVLNGNGIEIFSKDEGPDIGIKYGEKSIWVECVATEQGEGEDRVLDMIHNSVFDLPEREMLLRLSNALDIKFKKYQKYIDKGLVSKEDIFIIAITRGILNYLDPGIPLILKCLFRLGDLAIPIKRSDGSLGQPYYQLREEIRKHNESPVSMNFFESGNHNGISAIVYSQTTVLNHPEIMGGDCILVHNPNSTNPLPEKVFPFLSQHRLSGDKIVKI
jgi:type I restriction enzyme S subunit